MVSEAIPCAPSIPDEERRIDDGAGLFGIEILDQVHRTFDVGEQNRDRLALTLKRGIISSDACLYRRARRTSSALRFAPRAVERLAAFQTELCGCRILRVARRAAAREWRRAFDAELRPVRIFNSALRAAHRAPPARSSRS